jgi:hypothetical protein
MTIRSQVIRLASQYPKGHPYRQQLLATLGKVAIRPETEAFITWALQKDDRWSASATQKFVEKVTGEEPIQPVDAPTPKRGPLEVGEKVLCDRYRNTNPQNVDECEQYHDRVGLVKDRTAEGLTVQFYIKDTDQLDAGAVASFNGNQSGKATGLYRWTPKADYQEGAVGRKALVECVYLRGGTQQPPQRDIDALKVYVERGLARGEHRSDIYYTGYVGKFAYNQQGQVYFVLSSQQRDRPTAINPVVGKVLYIGLAGRRPGGWLDEARSMGIEV